MNRLVALVVLTAAFAPAAILGALPLVAPVVGALTIVLSLLLDRAPRSEAEPLPVAVEAPPRELVLSASGGPAAR